MPKLPEDCSTMPEVREGVDATDRELVALLARRFGYMRAAARINPPGPSPSGWSVVVDGMEGGTGLVMRRGTA